MCTAHSFATETILCYHDTTVGFQSYCVLYSCWPGKVFLDEMCVYMFLYVIYAQQGLCCDVVIYDHTKI